jgi:hypothetical protein
MGMTDRINALIVVLADDIREDDVQPLLDAIALLRGVVRVEMHVADLDAYIAKEQAKAFYRSKIFDVLTDD